MKRIAGFLAAHPGVCAVVFFATLLGIGLGLFRDYGLSWDERFQAEYGEMVYSYVAEGDEELLTDHRRHYGAVYPLLLHSVARALDLEDSRTVYLMRHLVTFLVFSAGVVFFYLLCAYLFRSRKVGILGALFLVLSPRVFAHGFYNPKDIPFMAVFIIGMYTLVRYLDKKTIRAALVHAIVCAIAIDLRVVGVMLPALTFLGAALIAAKYRGNRVELRKLGITVAVFAPVLVGLVILLWPTLWRAPLGSFIEAFRAMSRFSWGGFVFYRGVSLPSGELPWHYAPLWMAMTIPVAYLVFFAVGVGATVRSFLTGSGGFPLASRRDRFLVLFWFFFPLVYLIASGAVLYDGWRHLFFVYPALLVLALAGLVWVHRGVRSMALKRSGSGAGRAAAGALALLIALNLGYVTYFMIRYHPHQNLYFNHFAGGVRGAQHRFELDYWGLSYRAALEHILKVDERDEIRIYVPHVVGRDTIKILKPEDRARLVLVEKSIDSNYHLTTFRWQDRAKASTDPLHSVDIDGVPIVAVYRVRFM